MKQKKSTHHIFLVSLLVVIMIMGVVAYFVQRDLIAENIAGEAVKQYFTAQIPKSREEIRESLATETPQQFMKTTTTATCEETLYLERGLTAGEKNINPSYGVIVKLVKTQCIDVGRNPAEGKWAMGCLYEDVFNAEAEKVSYGSSLWGGEPYKRIESCTLKKNEANIEQCVCIAKIPLS